MARRAADTVLKVVSERSLFAAPSEGTVPARIAEPVSPARVPSIASPPILDVPPAPVSSPKGMAARFSAGGLSALQLALSTEADRGTLFLFVPILLAAGSLAYFTAPGEPLSMLSGQALSRLPSWRCCPERAGCCNWRLSSR